MHASRRPAPRLRRGRIFALSALAAAASAVAFSAPASATTGPYNVRYQEPSDLKDHTVYRPSTMPNAKLPVLIWGESGCIANGLIMKTFLQEIASHGIVVIANGGPNQIGTTNVGMMSRSLTWAKYQNTKIGGLYEGKIEVARVAVAGHSCGGLEAYQFAAKHPETAAVGIMNSGLLQPNQDILNKQKAPVLYVLGGTGDVAFSNGLRDFGRLPAELPAFLASDNNGHFGTYYQPNGGSYAKILKDWVKYQIDGDAISAATFTGPIWTGWKMLRRNIG